MKKATRRADPAPIVALVQLCEGERKVHLIAALSGIKLGVGIACYYLVGSCPADMVLICSPAYLVQAVKEASKCDAVFKGFSDCVVKMGQNIANYPQDLDDKKNLETICR